VRSHKNLGPIGSAVFTFIGYKQTNKQAKYIFIKEKIKDITEELIKILLVGSTSKTNLCDFVKVDWSKIICAKRQIFYTFFLLIVIMDMENVDQVSKRGCLCLQDSLLHYSDIKDTVVNGTRHSKNGGSLELSLQSIQRIV